MSQPQVQTMPQPVDTLQLQNGQFVPCLSNLSKEAEEIPIVDVSGMFSEKLEDRQAVAEKIREACHRIGFFYVINHGLDPAHAARAFQEAKRFFALPVEKKLEIEIGKVPNETVGYHPMESYACGCSTRKRKDLQESFNFAYSAQEDPEAIDDDSPGISLWPTDLPGFKEGLYGYHTPLLQFARRLTRIFALALHAPEDVFDKYIKHPEAEMRLSHYPHQELSIDDQNGLGGHTDFESFTIVTQDDTAGLEVLSKSGTWIKARPVPNSFVINVADCMMRQTNDYFVSTVHRVINKSGNERYSIPFFFGFDREMKLEPVLSCLSEDDVAKYPIMTSGEYFKWRGAQD